MVTMMPLVNIDAHLDGLLTHQQIPMKHANMTTKLGIFARSVVAVDGILLITPMDTLMVFALAIVYPLSSPTRLI